MTFRLLSKRCETFTDRFGNTVRRYPCEYEAQFWDGPIEAGQQGRRKTLRCKETFVPVYKTVNGICAPTGEHRALNTSPNVSYYGQLRKEVLK